MSYWPLASLLDFFVHISQQFVGFHSVLISAKAITRCYFRFFQLPTNYNSSILINLATDVGLIQRKKYQSIHSTTPRLDLPCHPGFTSEWHWVDSYSPVSDNGLWLFVQESNYLVVHTMILPIKCQPLKN